MLYNYFIVLCLGVYASCAPLRINEIQTSIEEIRKAFCKIKEKLEDHLNNSEEIRLDVPENLKEHCVRFHLKTFINLLSLDSVKPTHKSVIGGYNDLHQRLQSLDNELPAHHENGIPCHTIPESNLKLKKKLVNFLLKDLPTFLDLKGEGCPAISS